MTADPLARLEAYLSLLARWNSAYNLTSLRNPALMRSHHLADCWATVEPLRRELARVETARILDVGSGGGLPGVVLAVAEPAWDITCVDTVGKKAAFVRQVAVELGLPNLHAEHARVEALVAPPFDVIVARAFASLGDFTALTRGLLRADTGVWMAMKGKYPDEEIAALPQEIEVFHVEPLHVPGLEAERCVVWMRVR